MSLRTEMVRTASRFEEIGPAWDALWGRGGRHVFQTHGWIAAWWRSKPAHDLAQVQIGLCWDGSDLVAVMPFAARRHRGARVLEWAAKECSDYCDALVNPGHSEAQDAIARTWGAVSRSAGFDVAYLSRVRPDAALRYLTDETVNSGVRLRPGHRSDRSLQVGHDSGGGTAYFRSLSKKARNNHTRGKRILGESGPVVLRQFGPDDPIGALLERMIALKQQWLTSTGQRNRLLEHDARILRSLVEELRRQRVFRAFSLDCGDTIAAASINILGRSRMDAFFAAYDPRFDRASPGTLVMVEYLMWAFDNGISEVDFLCGQEDYKYKFANAEVQLGSFVAARTLAGRLALALDEGLDHLRKSRANGNVPSIPEISGLSLKPSGEGTENRWLAHFPSLVGLGHTRQVVTRSEGKHR